MNETAASAAGTSKVATATAPRTRGRLFRKHMVLFMAVVCTALIASGSLEIWFVYQEQTASLARFQGEQAAAASDKIGQSVKEIESQMGWTTQLPWSAETLGQRRLDAQRLLRLVPDITELTQLDAAGLEQLRVSPLAIDVVGSKKDLSQDAAFTQAMTNKVYYGPVYFRLKSEPYMTLSVAGARRDAGVSIAAINLRFIWDAVSRSPVRPAGEVYVVDSRGLLIAHSDSSLVLSNRDLAELPQIQAAVGGGGRGETLIGRNLQGRDVITAHAVIPALGWFVFVDLPLKEALAPVYASMQRTAILLLLGLVVATLAALLLARRMIVPIKALQAGAAQIGNGDLAHRIEVTTGDELEALADEFNGMAGRLQESYAGLEHRVEQRTLELARTVEKLDVAFKAEAAAKALVDDYARRLEGKIQVTEDKYRLFIEHARDGIFVLDTDGKIVEANRETESLLGRPRSDIIGRRLDSFVAATSLPDIQPGLDRILAEDSFRVEGMLLERTDGQKIHADISSSRVVVDNAQLVLFIARDVTEHFKLEQQLRQAQKMEAVGQLTGGIAHDFNNLLTVILGNTELVLDHLPIDQEAHGMVKTALGAAERGAELTHRLLAFSRRQTLEPEVVDVNAVIQGMQSLMRRTLGEDVFIVSDLGANLSRALVDKSQLESALLNLAVNARDAMPGGGTLTFESEEVEAGDENASLYDGMAAGRYVRITVGDTGTGMPPEVASRAFDPFFTTKDPGKGTGLGLAMVYGFVKQSGGHVKIYSELGQGTNITMYLPAADPRTDVGVSAAPRADLAKPATGTILLVEDEPSLRTLVETQLRSLGYSVIACGDGPAALDAFESGATFDLVFTDVVLPGGMNGAQLVDEIVRRKPGTRALFTSGYSPQVVERRGVLGQGVTLLRKPYRMAQLAEKVREAMEGEPYAPSR